MKKIILSILIFTMLATVVGCESKNVEVETEDKGYVNVYTTRHYDADDALYEEFTKQTGIKVNVVTDESAVSIAKIKEQGETTDADIFMTSDAGNLALAKSEGILQSISSDILNKNIPSKYRDIDSTWYGLTKRARVFLYSNERVSVEELNGLTYENLVTNDRWNKKVLVRSSSNIYNQSLIASFISILGEDETSNWVEMLVEDMARNPEGNDRVQAVAIKDGIGDIAIANSYYYGKLVNETDESSKYYGVSDKVSIYFPNQGEGESGVHINISGAGVVKGAKNKENAIKLLEFLSDKEQQGTFSATNYEFPVNVESEVSPLLQSWLDNQGIKELKEQDINLTDLGAFNEKALNIMIQNNWDNPVD